MILFKGIVFLLAREEIHVDEEERIFRIWKWKWHWNCGKCDEPKGITSSRWCWKCEADLIRRQRRDGLV